MFNLIDVRKINDFVSYRGDKIIFCTQLSNIYVYDCFIKLKN